MRTPERFHSNHSFASICRPIAYIENLAEQIRGSFRRRRRAFEEKQIVGGLCFKVEEKMCVGVSDDRLMCASAPRSRPAP